MVAVLWAIPIALLMVYGRIGMKRYNVPDSITAEEVKKFRKKLGMTQKEFAELLGVSKPTVERWENSEKKITGPVVMLIDLLSEHDDWLENREIPEQKYSLRLWYMYKNKKCTLIDVDEVQQKIRIKNYTNNIMFRAFGANTNPNYVDYEEFLKSRCFPETRDKIKIQLDALGIPFYDPMLIIDKTQGRMAEDDFWIMIER